MGTFCVTGAANGMGAATRRLLEATGHRVIGVDLRGSDIDADLGTEEGRRIAVAETISRCGGRLDGLGSIAGINGMIGPEPTVRINYFGALAMVEGLHDALAATGASSVVLISSIAAGITPGLTMAHAELFLAGDEQAAVDEMTDSGWLAYPAGKLALAHWVRRNAVTQRWIGQGIRVNAVAPGVTETPASGTYVDDDPQRDLRAIAMGRRGRPAEQAGAILFLLSDLSSYITGQTLLVDGGLNLRWTHLGGDNTSLFLKDENFRTAITSWEGP